MGTPDTTAFLAGKILPERAFRGYPQVASSVSAHPGWSWPWICNSDAPYLLNFLSKKQGMFTERWTESFFSLVPKGSGCLGVSATWVQMWVPRHAMEGPRWPSGSVFPVALLGHFVYLSVQWPSRWLRQWADFRRLWPLSFLWEPQLDSCHQARLLADCPRWVSIVCVVAMVEQKNSRQPRLKLD